MPQFTASNTSVKVPFGSRRSPPGSRCCAVLPSGAATTADLVSEFASFKSFMLGTLNTLQSQIHVLAKSVDRLEMQGRRKMLLLHGVQEQANEDLSQLMVRFVVDKLGVNEFTLKDIKRRHRMGQSRNNSDKPRPIIIKFEHAAIRDQVWFSKAKLKGSGATVLEFLTQSRRSTFIAAREKFGVNRCWTQEGIIHVLSPDNTRHRLTTIAELRSLQLETAKPVATSKAIPKARRAAGVKK
ncbi:unnamed protein product [Diatraea saccharalis]|uniref:Uncharacterized protein n=1 Tax=Diatraea saccharalis TaxID=40085 RepID=A0A9N9R664_9NEOP|nr:unnamed protein product [Diatraea saccharalis]